MSTFARLLRNLGSMRNISAVDIMESVARAAAHETQPMRSPDRIERDARDTIERLMRQVDPRGEHK